MRTNTEILIPTGSIELAGTWTTPEGEGPHPVALIVAGSGPLDRDGNVKSLPLSISADLADLLARNAWASVRFDKRGVGQSGGDYLSAGFWDEYHDVAAVFRWIQSQEGVGDIVAIGHSVGATMVSELAVAESGLSGIVMLAGTATTGEETLLWQTQQVKDHLLPKPIKTLLRVFGTDVVKQQAKALAKLKATTTDTARIQLAKVNAKWMREFIDYDPRPAIGQVETRLLAITGSKDVQVDSADLAVIRELAPHAETHEMGNVDHILREEHDLISNPRKYKAQVTKPIDGRVTQAITDWLARVNS